MIETKLLKTKTFRFGIGSTGRFILAEQGEKPYAYVPIEPQATAPTLVLPNKVKFTKYLLDKVQLLI